MDTAKPRGHAQFLLRATGLLGGERELRAFLGATPAQLAQWMAGRPMPPRLFLKLADLLTAHNAAFASRMRLRHEHLLEQHASLMDSSAGLMAADRASVAQAQETTRWSIELRAARARERDAAQMPPWHRLFDPAFVPADRAELLETALDATLAVAGTDLGNVQLLDPDGALRIEAQRGLSQRFLEFFSVVARPECACGVAVSQGRQVFIPDVRLSLLFLGTDAGEVLRDAGCASVASTPLRDPSGLVMGMISTHFRKPYMEVEQDGVLPLLARVADRTASWLDARALPAR